MEKSLAIVSIISIGILFFCSGLALWENTLNHTQIKKYILCGYAYGYTDTSPPSEPLNQTELLNRCKSV